MKKQILFLSLLLSFMFSTTYGQNPGVNTQSINNEPQYLYDANGNMIKDSNKNITNIEYNFLNLPKKVEFADGRSIEYNYRADGVKTRTLYKNGNNIEKTIDYCGSYIYEDGELSKITLQNGIGYITMAGNTPTYHYYQQDHQGNNRVVVDQNGNVEEVNHYYPFGEVFETAGNVQPYKYNGKEMDRTYGLNLYDYSARQMDPKLGRFTTMDPMAEKYYSISPYAYCKNNPVNRIDPDGKDDYRFSGIGHIHIVKETKNNGSKTDRLIAPNGSYIEVSDKSLLPGLSINKGGDSSRRRFYNATSNMEDAVNVFKFSADNTDREWKLDVYTDGETQSAIVATDLQKSSVSLTDDYDEAAGKNKIIDIHSHPDENGTRGGSVTDMNKANEKSINAVYHKKDKKLYQYNRTQSSYNPVPVANNEDLLKQVKTWSTK